MLAHHTWLQPAPRLACGVFDYDCTSDPPQFSWRSVAASAITAGVGEAVGPAFGNAFGNSAAGQFGAQVATRFTSGLVAQAVTAKGGKINVGQIAVDAFGQSLASSIVGQINQASQQEQRAGFSQAGASAMDAEYGIGVQNDGWAHQAQQQAHLERAGFIDAGRDTMGPESGVWGQQAAFANEALTQRSEDMRDAAMGQLMGLNQSPADNRSLLNAVERGINPGAYTSVAGSTVRAPNNGQGISSLIGTSNPQAVGNFMRANGMTSDNLQGGRNYFIPDSTTAYGNSTALGQYGLNLGNARAAALNAATQATNADEVQRLFNRSAAAQSQGVVAAGAASGVNLIPGAVPGQVAPAPVTTKFGSFLNWAEAQAARTRDNLVAAIPGVGPDLYQQGVGAKLSSLDPFQNAVDAGRELQNGNYGPAALTVANMVPVGKVLKNVDTVVDAARGVAADGKTVLGHFPEYKQLGENLNARTFNIPEAAWNKLSETERWAANQKFLDRMIARSDEIILATPLDKVRPGSYFARELEYLGSKGYVPSANGTRLIKR